MVTCRDQKSHQNTKKRIDSCVDHDVICTDPMVFRQCLPQIMVFRVGIHPSLCRCLLHGFDGAGGGAKDALICPKAGFELRASGAFPAPLVRQKGTVCGQGGCKAGQAWIIRHAKSLACAAQVCNGAPEYPHENRSQLNGGVIMKLSRRGFLASAAAAATVRAVPQVATQTGGRRILTLVYDKALGVDAGD